MIEWSNSYDATTKYSMRLAGVLDEDQITSIWNRSEFQVDGKYLALLIDLLGDRFDKDALRSELVPKDGRIRVGAQYAEYVEYQWTRYLNRLESTLAAWSCHVAREDMMEGQFKKLLKLREGLLEKLTRLDPASVNDPCHPTIADFLARIKQNKPLPASRRF